MPSRPNPVAGQERIAVHNLCVDYHGVVAVHEASLHLESHD